MAAIKLPNDLREFLRFANSEKVEQLIVGGVAGSFYGGSEAVDGLEIWARASAENAGRLAGALGKSGFELPKGGASALKGPGQDIVIGTGVSRLRIGTEMPGVEFEESFARRMTADIEGTAAPVISLGDLRRSKRASGRAEDLRDLERLPKIAPVELPALNERFNTASTGEILTWAWETFGERAAIGTSFQGAGLVMMHLAREQGLKFPVFTMDTGLLFPETVALHQRLEDFFGHKIERMVPDLTVEQQAEANGPELWKRDPDLCCTMRKVLPLRSKLSELDCWITGLRRQQSDTRSNIGIVEIYEFDEGRDLAKLNPMANWAREDVWKYLHDHQIPYNPLHDQGYKSIGCQPCTAKDKGGENERGGRWIGFNKVECGIHTFMPKKS